MNMLVWLELPLSNVVCEWLTERTPGTPLRLAWIWSYKPATLTASYPFKRGLTLNMTRFRVLKPTSTLRRFCRVRKNSPAPISTTSEIATWTTSNDLLRNVRDRVTLRLVSFIEPDRSTLVERSAGNKPNAMPVIKHSEATKPNTRQSRGAVCANGSNCRLQ